MGKEKTVFAVKILQAEALSKKKGKDHNQQ